MLRTLCLIAYLATVTLLSISALMAAPLATNPNFPLWMLGTALVNLTVVTVFINDSMKLACNRRNNGEENGSSD